jgi:hypothetical protein
MRDIKTALSDSKLQKAIRNCFYISTAISPLVMLNPRQYGKDEFKVESLVPVSYYYILFLSMLMQIDKYAISLGNDKPTLLALTEKALWRTLLSIASGGNAHDELNVFLDTYTSLCQKEIDAPKIVDWYTGGKVSIYLFFTRVSFTSPRQLPL